MVNILEINAIFVQYLQINKSTLKKKQDDNRNYGLKAIESKLNAYRIQTKLTVCIYNKISKNIMITIKSQLKIKFVHLTKIHT